ncbi:MAG TPA: lysophospholipid acyltransferase family protein [Ignavibacteria bacterium]|nr:lysophospholipid acyltransferase family protein [Ignavibacteria bacterium]
MFWASFTLISASFNYKHKIGYFILKNWTRGGLLLYGIKVNLTGVENIEKGKGHIYVSNHLSYLDILVLLATIPDNIRMVYKSEISRIPIFGWAMLACGFISIDRSNIKSAMRSLEKGAQKVKKGLSVLIFPEGTRSPDGKTGEFKRGMFLLAEKSGADIIPVSISGTYELLPRNSTHVSSGKVNLVLEKPMNFRKDKQFTNELREVVVKNIKPVN